MLVLRIRRAVVAVATAIALSSSCAAPVFAQTRPTLKIGAAPSDLGAQVLYAHDLGYFEKAGLDADISLIPSGPTIMAAVASQDLNIGWGNAIDVSEAHQRGIPITIIATATVEDASVTSTGLLSVARSSGIHSAKDLIGKTIAVLSLRNLTEVATRAWLDENGGDSKSVHFIELPYSQMPAALQAGRVDAAVLDNTADPTLGKPGSALDMLTCIFSAVTPNRKSWRIEGAVWYANSDWVSQHPDVARQFVAVMKQAGEWGNSHHHESAQILSAHIPRSAEQIEGTTRVMYGTELSRDLLQPELDLAFKYGLLSKPVPARDIITVP